MFVTIKDVYCGEKFYKKGDVVSKSDAVALGDRLLAFVPDIVENTPVEMPEKPTTEKKTTKDIAKKVNARNKAILTSKSTKGKK